MASQELGIVTTVPTVRVRPLAAALVAGASAFLAGLAITPWVRDAARRRRWVDAPGGRLQTHAAAVAPGGGVAVFVAFGFGLVAAAHPAWGAGWRGGALFVAVGAVLLVGLAHDLRGIALPARLALQAAAAVLLCAHLGVVHAIALPGGGSLALGSFGWPLTVLWLVGVARAFRLADGLDGVAAGSGSVSLAVLMLAALAHGEPSAPAAAALAGALLGFLRYNRPPASACLGDAGSLSIGFALAALALDATTNDAGEVAAPVVLLALALPLAEGAFTIVRRLRPGRSLFAPDREHIHDRLLARGLDRQTAARTLVALAGSCACLAWFLLGRATAGEVVGARRRPGVARVRPLEPPATAGGVARGYRSRGSSGESKLKPVAGSRGASRRRVWRRRASLMKRTAPFGLTPREAQTLRRLTPATRLQRFLDDLEYDVAGGGCRSPRRVLRERTVQCMDGALFAAAALRVQGRRPLVWDLESVNDDDHVLAIFQERGCWGAIARSNYSGLRFREPIHRTLRELALSYVESYFNLRREKTLAPLLGARGPLALRPPVLDDLGRGPLVHPRAPGRDPALPAPHAGSGAAPGHGRPAHVRRRKGGPRGVGRVAS